MPGAESRGAERHAALRGRRVLVTGGTGFIGRQLVESLRAAGCPVRVALRRPPPAAAWPDGVEPVTIGDLGPHTDWDAALAGVDAVVHAAAHVHVMRPGTEDLAAFERVNVQGTARLAERAAAARVRRFVFLSSIMVNGEDSGAHAFRAEDEPRPANAYARSKLDAERALRAVAARADLGLAIVRPPLVYGSGVGGNFARLLRACEAGWPLPLAGIRNRRSLISVWNLADFVLLALWHPAAAGRIWLVCDGEDVSTPELLSRAARALGRRARLVPVPAWLLAGGARLTGHAAELRRLTGSLVVDAGPALRELDWRAPLSLDAGLRRTVVADPGQP